MRDLKTSRYLEPLTDLGLNVYMGVLLATSNLTKCSFCPVTQAIAHFVGAVARMIFMGNFPGMNKRKVNCVMGLFATGICELVTMVVLALLSIHVGGLSARLLLQALMLGFVSASFQMLIGVLVSRAFDCAELDNKLCDVDYINEVYPMWSRKRSSCIDQFGFVGCGTRSSDGKHECDLEERDTVVTSGASDETGRAS